MDNASWRDTERELNVKKFKENDKKEALKSKEENYDALFLQ